ncbi:MipA/OmpV family protein [Motilimonas sp. KMU-193]|uniref:MipA/OmpV family protein n=1 Tax=Motilimonas sp. KMU-193 TaxID=3388668 RepID=UPI00396B028C
MRQDDFRLARNVRVLCWLLVPFWTTLGYASTVEFNDLVPNYIGLGVGSTSQWSGSTDSLVGAVPGMRVKLENNRYAEWAGPFMAVKVNTHPNFEFGPIALLHLGRNDVDNEKVKHLPDIDFGLSMGGYVGYRITKTDTTIPFSSRFGMTASTAVAGDTKGSNLGIYANTWVPLSYQLFVGLGVGATFADDKYMQHYYGVDSEASLLTGISEFDAAGGNRQVYLWPAVLYQVTPSWYVGAAMFYQRLTGDAAKSSIVKEQGSKNQYTYGVGIGYAW